MRAPILLALGAAIGLGVGIFVANSGFGVFQSGDGSQANSGSNTPGRQAGNRGGRQQAGGRGRGYRPVVAMTHATQSAITRRIDVIGEARSSRSVSITSEVTGIVEDVNIAPGARVNEGDLLLSINNDEQKIALARAQADFPIARDNAERFRNLESDEAASEQEAEQAQNAFIAARAELRAAEVAFEQRRITAPFNGIAGLTGVEKGDYLRAGDVVTTLDDTSNVIVEFSVPQEDASFIEIGQIVTANLTSLAGKKYEGVVSAIDSRVDTDSRTLRVEATFENIEGRLLPGAVFAVSTESEGAAAISLPGLAIQWDRSGAFVWRRNAEGMAERASIIVLQRRDDVVLVEGDVKAKDVIVAEGADRVRNGVELPNIKPQNIPSGGGQQVGAAFNQE